MSPDPIRRKGRKTLAKIYDSLSDPEEAADRSRIIGLPTKKEARGIRDELTAAAWADGQGIHQHRRIILPQAAGHQKRGAANPADGYSDPAGTAEGHPRNQPRRV